MIIPERLEQFQTAQMGRGYRKKFDSKASPIEWAAYLAGEPHTATPKCVCPIIAAVVEQWNLDLSCQKSNQLLKDFVPKLIGSVGTPEVTEQRGWMVMDWHVHIWLSAWAQVSNVYGVTEVLASLPRITDLRTVRQAMYALDELFNSCGREWRFGIRAGEVFEAVNRSQQWAMSSSGVAIPEHVFETVMLKWPNSSVFGLSGSDSNGTWPPPGWWPPLIRITNNLAWFPTQARVWPALKGNRNAQVEAERIFYPVVEAQHRQLRALIGKMLAL